MRNRLALITASLVACGSVSPVVSVDTGVYMVASHGVLGNGSASAEKVKAVQAATEYCQSKGQTVQIDKIESVDPFFGRAPSAEVRFRCATK